MSHNWHKAVEFFDFELAAQRMKELGWKWYTLNPPAPPTAEQLREEAERLFKELVRLDADSISTGGLEARYLGEGEYMLSWGQRSTSKEDE